jgi:hypothetical protein
MRCLWIAFCTADVEIAIPELQFGSPNVGRGVAEGVALSFERRTVPVPFFSAV